MVELSSAAAAAAGGSSSASASAARLPVPPSRSVARPITNLGNTCYMNAVLQALAHAPELCLAMDCDPHFLHCPVAQENRRRRQASPVSSSASPEDNGNTTNGNASSSSSHPNAMMENDFRRKPARKLRRSSRKSPTNGMSGNTTTNNHGEGSPGHDSNNSNNSSNNNAMVDSADDGGQIYCALCEMEFHLQEVHHPAPATTSAAATSSTVINVNKAVEPEMFATGFIHHVAPHFKMGNQEDSHEFLRLLIDAMQHSAKNARLNRAKNNSSSSKRYRTTTQKEHQPHEDTRMDNTSLSSSPSTRSSRRTSLTVPTQTNDTDTAKDDSYHHHHSSKTTTSSSTGISPFSKTSHNNKNSNSSTSEEDTEYPFQLFRGTVESCVTCDSCQATSSTLDPIEDVGLEVTPPSPGPYNNPSSSTAAEALADVSSAFRRFARVEDLDSGYKCESCGKGGRATKQSRLASIPPILTLHLKRFRYGGDARGPSQAASLGGSNSRRTTKSGSAKIEGHIKFEQIFDLKPYLTDELQAKQKAMFCRLFAVVVHAGKNSHSGHYIAYVRNIQKNEWWKMDDARITKVDMQEVMQAEAYMLFYRVVEHPFALHLKEKSKILQEEREALAKKERLAAAAHAAATTTAVEVHSKKETDEAVAEKENVPTPSHSPKEGTGAESSETAPDPAKPKATTPDQNRKQGPSTRSATKAASAASPTTSSNGKKRTLPDYLDGKSWAKKNTRLKPEHYNSIRSAEEYVNENVQLKPDFFKLITEEGSKEDAKVGKCNINLISGM